MYVISLLENALTDLIKLFIAVSVINIRMFVLKNIFEKFSEKLGDMHII